jgi:hypothetical protein
LDNVLLGISTAACAETAFHLGNLPQLLGLPSLEEDDVLALPLIFVKF